MLYILTVQLATCADIRQKRDAAEGDEATTEAITDLLKKKWDEIITDENLNKVKNQLNLAGEQAKDLGEKLLVRKLYLNITFILLFLPFLTCLLYL